jgi:hypothetical protein
MNNMTLRTATNDSSACVARTYSSRSKCNLVHDARRCSHSGWPACTCQSVRCSGGCHTSGAYLNATRFAEWRAARDIDEAGSVQAFQVAQQDAWQHDPEPRSHRWHQDQYLQSHVTRDRDYRYLKNKGAWEQHSRIANHESPGSPEDGFPHDHKLSP